MSPDEKTYYNIRRLHLAFAVASLLLVAATLWMLLSDHRRQWKGFQSTYRDKVEPWVTESRLLAEQKAADETDEQHQETLRRLEEELQSQTPGAAEKLLRLPIIDALGRTLSIEQIWLPELTIDYNFRDVPRFDRCITCHQGIDRTRPGDPSQAAFPPEKLFELELPQSNDTSGGTLKDTFGFELASRGILDAKTPTIALVLPQTPAAMARLAVGDAIVQIGGHPVKDIEDVKRTLLERRPEGPIALSVRRGLPEPYCGHPRLDLMVGSSSPHPMADFGCTICHDGQGSATDFRWASHSPDNLEQAGRWRKEHGWSRNPHWDFPMLPARFAQSGCLKCHHEVVDLQPSRRFPDPPAATLVEGYQLVRRNGCFGCHEIKGIDPTGRRVGPDLRLAGDDIEAAEAHRLGLLKKVGPNLRYAVDRMDRDFMAEVIADPTAFRSDSRMPRLFALHDHLNESQAANSEQLETVEIRGIVEHIQANSEYASTLREPYVFRKPSAQRGRRVFSTQGCLACHRHEDFPQAESVQGPDLSNLGAKYTTPAGREWLDGWIHDPAAYWPKTLMPNPLLETGPLIEKPLKATINDLRTEGRYVDPAADAAAFLLSFKGDYRPAKIPEVDEAVLDEWLASHPDGCATAPLSMDEKLQTVGRMAISRRGCYGCHEIPGFAKAKPIGPALSDWGRKLPALLAFEKIHEYVKESRKEEDNPDRNFYLDALLSHRREGFIWQKLRRPRSFDFGLGDQKSYHERLTMGQFEFTPQQREAIITFVLGLTADPPAETFVYRPDSQRKAVIEGRKLIEKYGCAECHMLRPQRWAFDFDPKLFENPPETKNFDFVLPMFTAEQLAASRRVDDRGLGHAAVLGMPRADASGRLLEDEDDDGNPLYFFALWQAAAINGRAWNVGGLELMISQPQLTDRRGPDGGAFARLLHPMVLAEASAAGMPAPPVEEAWGWVPPPLFGEGAKVRRQWLREYLLRPHRIRPAVVLKMPRFGMSEVEADKLAAYFTAEAELDEQSFPQADFDHVMPRELRLHRFDEALRLMVDDKTFCAKCHAIADDRPSGAWRTTFAPNLADVQGRIKPDYLRRWLGDPRSILPYTAMPVNFPPTGPPLGQDILPGSSAGQISEVTQLLLNFDRYMRDKTPVRAVIGPTPAEK